MLPTVDFCGLNPTRLIIGANPFGGFSHQNQARNDEMRSYYTVERILETWERAEAAGINTMVTNNETPHVLEAVKQYLSSGGRLQWIAQLSMKKYAGGMPEAIETAAEIGAKAVYIHGGVIDEMYDTQDADAVTQWMACAKSCGVLAGVAGHSPEAHDWVNSLDATDFHVVCFFRCGSLHRGQGLKFKLRDVAPAVECIRRISKPCIGYKIMGAGRIDATMAFEYAFENIKSTDVVNVGMHRGDKDDMVEEDVRIVKNILGAA